MSLTLIPKRHVVLAVLAAALFVSSSRADESNRNEVRANLEKDGWSVAWGKNFTEVDWARGLKAIASSVAEENPGPFLEWFSQTIDQNFSKIERNLEGVTRKDLERWIVQSLKEKKIITYKGLRLEAGFATYDRWQRIVYDEPRTRMEMRRERYTGIQTEVPVAYTERVERTTNLPNWHQFYIRYKLAGAGNQPSRPRTRPNDDEDRPRPRPDQNRPQGPSIKQRLDSAAGRIERLAGNYAQFMEGQQHLPEAQQVLIEARRLRDAASRVQEARSRSQAVESVKQVDRSWDDLRLRLDRLQATGGTRARRLLPIGDLINEMRDAL